MTKLTSLSQITLCLLSTLSLLTISTSFPLIQIDPWGLNSMRIRIACPNNNIQNPPLMGLLPTPPDRGNWQEQVYKSDDNLTITNGNIQIITDPTTGYITVVRISDSMVLFRQTNLVFGAAPAGTKLNACSGSISFAGVNSTERIYGFGEQQDGQVAKTLPFFRSIESSEYYPYNHGSQALVGWYMSTAGYGFLWNLPGYGYYSVANDVSTFFANATNNLDFFITTIPDSFNPSTSQQSILAPLLQQYADAVGHGIPLPYFATGFVHSKDRYFNQSQFLAVARGYTQRKIPISMITIDWFHWNVLGNWSFNLDCWPNPQAMYTELADMGIELMITFWPFMNDSSVHWPEFTQRKWLALYEPDNSYRYFWTYQQWGDLVDTTNPYAQQRVFDAFWDSYGSLGVKAIWLDETEPDRAGYTYGLWNLTAGTDYEVGAAWKKSWIETFAQGFRSKGIMDGEFFLLSRSFWAGTQQFGNAVWSGDLDSTFAELQLQIAAAQGAGLTAQGLWTSDIGGYNGGNTSDPMFGELIVRWFQFGAFSSIMRLHGHRINNGYCTATCGCTNGDNEIWTLAQSETAYNAMVDAVNIRENIRNYVAEIQLEHVNTGIPMIRPMFFQWPQDAGCQGTDVEDQYMFGDSWLVAPVYTYQATTRSVYLPTPPPGAVWIYFFNQTVVSGGQRINVATPLDEFPLFFLSITNATHVTTPAANVAHEIMARKAVQQQLHQ